MEENVAGELMDLSHILKLPKTLDIYNVSTKIRGRYEHIWSELTLDELFMTNQRYRIHERIKRINDLGFTVDEIELVAKEDGKELSMKPFVTDRNYHQTQLHSLTGILAEETQACLILNEINELKATSFDKEIPIYNVAFKWVNENYLPTVSKLGLQINSPDAPELYCEVLEHKWFLSEKAKKDIGLETAIMAYIRWKTNKNIKKLKNAPA